MSTSVYVVEGMTCDHCARAVRSELAAVDGVTGVEVDLTTGEVSVRSELPVEVAAVRTAVEAAGYQVTSP